MTSFKKHINAKAFGLTFVDEQYNNVWSRAGNLYDVEDKIGHFYCESTRAFDHNVLLPNGDVTLCCMDFSLKHIIGNLFVTKFDKLNRDKIIELSKQNKSDVICRKCELFELKFKLPFGIKIS